MSTSQSGGRGGRGGGRIFFSFHSHMLDITMKQSFVHMISLCVYCVYIHTQRAVVCSAAV